MAVLTSHSALEQPNAFAFTKEITNFNKTMSFVYKKTPVCSAMSGWLVSCAMGPGASRFETGDLFCSARLFKYCMKPI